MIKVLYICHDENTFGGAALSLENMINSVRSDVCPTILFRKQCVVSTYFENKGIECIYSFFPLSICDLDYELSFAKKWYSRFSSYKQFRDNAKNIYNNFSHREFDIVHSNSSVYIVGFFLAKLFHAKHIWHVRESLDIDQNKKPILGWNWMRHLLASSDHVIFITKAVQSHWKYKGIKNAFVHWNAIRSKKEIIYIREKKKYFLFCSNILWYKKGADVAVKAFAISELWKKGYTLKMVGNKHNLYQQKLEQLILNLKIQKYVDFPGPTNDVKSYMKDAMALLMCSEYEGLGRVTVEAMFYGCPVIGHNTGGTAEIVTHNQTGLLYDNVNDCAEMMKRVAVTDMSSIIINAQHHAVKNFSEEEYGQFILNIYNGKK